MKESGPGGGKVLSNIKQRGKDKARALREDMHALRYVAPFLKLVWQTHHGYTVAIVLLRLLRAFVPVVMLWTGKLIIDAILAAQNGTAPDLSRLWKLVAIEVGAALAGEVMFRGSSITENLLGDLFSSHTSVRLMEHAAKLDLYQFEDPAFYDQLERARRQTTDRTDLLGRFLNVGQDALTLLSLGAALFVHSPWLLMLLVVTVLPSFLGETHFASLQYALLYRRTPKHRQLDYMRYICSSDQTVKEVQMFGLAPWLVECYRAMAGRFHQENRRLSIRKGVAAVALSVVGILGYYVAYVHILLLAVAGAISLGSLSFLAASFRRSRDLTQRLLTTTSDIYEQSLYFKDLFLFFEMRPSITSPPGAPEVPPSLREGIVFEDVGFQYPGSDAWAVRHVSFRLSPGESLALVGENGAGKTTLTKLLARLYDVTEGRILWDGRDLREYDLASVRRAVGVIFQDFVCYDLCFDENIGVGEIDKVRGYLELLQSGKKGAVKSSGAAAPAAGDGDAAVPKAVVTAAEKSLAASLLPRLPGGYRQMLGRRFDEGVDLSGGEWQKIALARAYMRDAQLLILDEPTSALDARAEYEVFKRFAELIRGRMAIIISHRFSTVRMADRIVVLQGGRLVEVGTHQQLVERGGLYEELFRLQADGYR